MPDEPEAHGLMALMLIHHARRRARFAGRALVLLEDQDRSLWDGAEIVAGRDELARAIALRGRGAYVLQAAIASLQTEEQIDWLEVAALYRQLAELTRSPWSSSTGPSLSRRRAPPARRLRSSTGSSSTTIGTCTRPGRSCCGAWSAPGRPGANISGRSSSRTPSRSERSWLGESPSLARYGWVRRQVTEGEGTSPIATR